MNLQSIFGILVIIIICITFLQPLLLQFHKTYKNDRSTCLNTFAFFGLLFIENLLFPLISSSGFIMKILSGIAFWLCMCFSFSHFNFGEFLVCMCIFCCLLSCLIFISIQYLKAKPFAFIFLNLNWYILPFFLVCACIGQFLSVIWFPNTQTLLRKHYFCYLMTLSATKLIKRVLHVRYLYLTIHLILF